MLFIFMQSNQI